MATFPRNNGDLHQNGLLIFFRKKTHSEKWKPSRISSKKVTTTTANLEIAEDLVCDAKNLVNLWIFRSFFYLTLFFIFSLFSFLFIFSIMSFLNFSSFFHFFI